MSNANKKYLSEYNKWLNSSALSKEERDELISISDNEAEKEERFSQSLTFGTAGLRAIMRTGLNALNRHTVAHATQAIAKVLKSLSAESSGVVIAYDSRINSKSFAHVAASVLAANGIHVFIFDELRPTPELSFALRDLRCAAGINITASHNPKQYNGYKLYFSDGAQISPEYADMICEVMNSTDVFADILYTDFDKAVENGLISIIGDEIDSRYLDAVQAQAVDVDALKNAADSMKIIYTPLHGAGYRLIPELMINRFGLKHFITVPEQAVPDGQFPTLAKPNPESPEAFTLGIELAEAENASLIIATDPDADRVGAAARTADGSFVTVTGNQMGALLLEYILTAYENTNTMPIAPYAVKSIVTTELIAKICKNHKTKLHNVLTGFKFIGEVIKNYEETNAEGTFVFGLEESYGYLKGTYARDKDAVVASMLICEMTAYYHAKGLTLSDALSALYQKYGYYFEKNVEIFMPGVDGNERRAAFMAKFRDNIPKNIGSYNVMGCSDYLSEKSFSMVDGSSEPTGLPSSDVIEFRLESNDTIIIRPSGTEPKVKIYFMLSAETQACALEKFEKIKKAISDIAEI